MLIKTLLKPQENDEDLFYPKVPYFSVIRALLYLANYTLHDIAFAVKGWFRDPKYSFMWKSSWFIYKVFANENFWAIDSQDWTLSS